MGQGEGNSLARQAEAAEAYAAAHNLTIDRERSFRDLGVSAWDKSNVRKGALGLFLQAVEDGKIAPGTTLIVESFDRLSRAEPIDALSIFTHIISAGLNIVTLTTPPKLFSRASIKANTFQLFEALLDMHRAHAESERKSQLVGNAWGDKKKRALASGEIMSAKAPHWIDVVVDAKAAKKEPSKRKAKLHPERTPVVLKILELAANGVGNHTIIRTLHAEGIPAWSASGKWEPSYVQKLLHNPALYGGIKINGEIKLGYYPAVIDKARFDHIVSIRAERATTKNTNRGGALVTNLFSGRLKCGYCGSAMNIAGYKSRVSRYERKYVACHGARIGAAGKCKTMKMWFMDELEPKLLMWLTGIDYSALVGGDQSKLDAERQVLAGLQADLQQVRSRVANTQNAIAEGESPRSLVKLLASLDDEDDYLAAAVVAQEKTVSALAAQDISGKTRMASLLAIVKGLKRTKDPVKLRALREQLSALIASTVKTIALFPAGPSVQGNKSMRYMVATLKNGKSYEIDDSDDGDGARVDRIRGLADAPGHQ
jgi:DNA invertase Pin-like site-specific DNA recombinase